MYKHLLQSLNHASEEAEGESIIEELLEADLEADLEAAQAIVDEEQGLDGHDAHLADALRDL